MPPAYVSYFVALMFEYEIAYEFFLEGKQTEFLSHEQTISSLLNQLGYLSLLTNLLSCGIILLVYKLIRKKTS